MEGLMSVPSPEEAKAKGATLIDAPLGNTPKEAELGKLNAFVGADDATFAKVLPIIRTWAENITHVGGVGAGHKAKLINNFIAMGYVAAAHSAPDTRLETEVGGKRMALKVSAMPFVPHARPRELRHKPHSSGRI